MSYFVKFCSNYRRKCQKEGKVVQFHRFPTGNEALRNEWRQLCGRPSEDLKSDSRICSEHFNVSDYASFAKSELLSNAKPSKNLPSKFSSLILTSTSTYI